MVRYGAKALPEGGWCTVPRVYADGVLIAGDAGGFLNSMRLKGIHLAMRTGMLAAETAFDAVRAGDGRRRAAAVLRTAHRRQRREGASSIRCATSIRASATVCWPAWRIRGCRWCPAAGGCATRCRRTPATSGWRSSRTITGTASPIRTRTVNPAKIDRQLTFDRLTNVHYSGTRHAEDQPSHLIVHDTDICRTRCREEYGNPCTRFCPANVYEMVDAGDGTKRLQINASNCVHCKTCDIMDPYQIIDWVPPEGGGGPQVRRHVAEVLSLLTSAATR